MDGGMFTIDHFCHGGLSRSLIEKTSHCGHCSGWLTVDLHLDEGGVGLSDDATASSPHDKS
jgi:hypothetical protein